ncbi:hypothetical protein BKA93DRAFT_869887 [Sparassis latifolia]
MIWAFSCPLHPVAFRSVLVAVCASLAVRLSSMQEKGRQISALKYPQSHQMSTFDHGCLARNEDRGWPSPSLPHELSVSGRQAARCLTLVDGLRSPCGCPQEETDSPEDTLWPYTKVCHLLAGPERIHESDDATSQRLNDLFHCVFGECAAFVCFDDVLIERRRNSILRLNAVNRDKTAISSKGGCFFSRGRAALAVQALSGRGPLRGPRDKYLVASWQRGKPTRAELQYEHERISTDTLDAIFAPPILFDGDGIDRDIGSDVPFLELDDLLGDAISTIFEFYSGDLGCRACLCSASELVATFYGDE